MKRRKFDRELKENAVKMVLKGDRTMTEVAESLGLKVWHLSNWTREYAKKGTMPFRGMARDPRLMRKYIACEWRTPGLPGR